MFCPNCGNQCNDNAVICVKCGCALRKQAANIPNCLPVKSRAVYIILWLLLGAFGVHNFYAGRVGLGVTELILMILNVLFFVLFFWTIICPILMILNVLFFWTIICPIIWFILWICDLFLLGENKVCSWE